MNLWIDGVKQPDAPDVLYPVEWAKKLAKQLPASRILVRWYSIPGKQYGEGTYSIDPTHPLVGTHWRSKDKRDVAANHNQDRKLVYIQRFNHYPPQFGLKTAGSGFVSCVKALDTGPDRYERIA